MKKYIIVIITVFYSFLYANMLSATADTWTRKDDFGGGARYGSVGFSIGSKGYIGMGGEGSYKKDFWEYEPVANTWTQKADFGGAARYGSVGFSIGSKGYIGMGSDSASPKKDFWEYDPAANTWTQKADFGGTVRYGSVGFSIGSKGYIGMGSDGAIIMQVHLKDFWEYEPAANTWTQKADFGGAARYGSVGFSIGSNGYIGMGSITQSHLSINLKDFWEYEPVANTWTQKADFGGGPRSGSVGFSIGSKGYIGMGAAPPIGPVYLKDFWEYDPAANAWTQKAGFGGGPRSGSVGFSIGSKGYIGMGFDGSSPKKDFWEYDTISAGGSGGGGCFIATAAFGSHLDPHVIALREFRDDFLLTNPIGEAFVGLYYRVSPPIAEYIAEHEFLRTVTRLTIIPVILVAKYPGLLFIFLLSIIAFAAVRFKRMKVKSNIHN